MEHFSIKFFLSIFIELFDKLGWRVQGSGGCWGQNFLGVFLYTFFCMILMLNHFCIAVKNIRELWYWFVKRCIWSLPVCVYLDMYQCIAIVSSTVDGVLWRDVLWHVSIYWYYCFFYFSTVNGILWRDPEAHGPRPAKGAPPERRPQPLPLSGRLRYRHQTRLQQLLWVQSGELSSTTAMSSIRWVGIRVNILCMSCVS